MIFPILLCIRAELTWQSWQNHIKNKSSLPMYLMIYAPWCHACQTMHPYFIKVQDEYENDPDVIVAGADCVAHPQICKYLNNSGYPNYYFIYNNSITKDYADTSVGTLLSFIEPIIKFARGPPKISAYNPPITSYPSFVFFIDSDDKERKHYLMHASYQVHLKDNQLFLNTTKGYPAYPIGYAYLDPSTSFQFTGDFATERIVWFINHYMKAISSEWSLESIMRGSFPFSIFVGKSANDSFLLMKLAKKFANESEWGSASAIGMSNVMNHFKLSDANLPAIIFIDPITSQYSVLKNIASADQAEHFFHDGTAQRMQFKLEDTPAGTRKAKFVIFGLVSGVSVAFCAFFAIKTWNRTPKSD